MLRTCTVADQPVPAKFANSPCLKRGRDLSSRGSFISSLKTEILIMRGGVAHQLTTQLVFQQFAVSIHHQFYEVVKLDLGPPAQNALGFARVALETIYFRRAKVSGIDFNTLFPVETSILKSGLQEFANAVSLA